MWHVPTELNLWLCEHLVFLAAVQSWCTVEVVLLVQVQTIMTSMNIFWAIYIVWWSMWAIYVFLFSEINFIKYSMWSYLVLINVNLIIVCYN